MQNKVKLATFKKKDLDLRCQNEALFPDLTGPLRFFDEGPERSEMSATLESFDQPHAVLH